MIESDNTNNLYNQYDMEEKLLLDFKNTANEEEIRKLLSKISCDYEIYSINQNQKYKSHIRSI